MFDQVSKGIQDSVLQSPAVQGVHKAFEGNDAYKEALSEFKKIDWGTADFNAIQDTAKRVTKKAAGEGIKVGAKLLGEFMMEWAVPLGIAGGPLMGGASMALGAALEWGTDMLYGLMWPETVVYKPGDIVLINKTGVSRPKARRRRMPHQEAMTAGIILSQTIEGKAELFNLEKSVNEWVPTQDLKEIPEEQVRLLRAKSHELANLQDGVKALSRGGDAIRAEPPHNTRVGDHVEYGGRVMEITGSGSGQVELTGEYGHRTVVNVGNGKLKDVYGPSSPDVERGQIVWFPAYSLKGYELAVVISVLHRKEVSGISLLTGRFLKERMNLVYSSEFSPQRWPKFVQAALSGDSYKWNDALPSKDRRFQSLLVTQDPTGDPLVEFVQQTSTSDDYQLEANHPGVLLAAYDDPYYDPWAKPTKTDGNSGNMVLIIGAAGVLAYLLIT